MAVIALTRSQTRVTYFLDGQAFLNFIYYFPNIFPRRRTATMVFERHPLAAQLVSTPIN